MSRPLVTVVVAAFQVGEYLPLCLDSVARQSVAARTARDVQVVVVDDGSTDDTANIADRYASAHPGWVALHTANRGLSAARNIGAGAAAGRWLMFLDGDDLLPQQALERLLTSAHRSGSWVVSGGVLRWDGTQLSASELHRLALHSPLDGGHIRRDHRLVYDTTAWNKLVLRTFWTQEHLCYPEGRLFEDLATSFATHLRTNATNVVPDPVYVWRIRTGGTPSITQRLGEATALEDRMTALTEVDLLAHTSGVTQLRDAHDAKAIDIDLRRFVAFLPGAGEAYRQRFLDLANAFLDHVPAHVVASRDPLRRLVVAAIRERRLDVLDDIAVARSGAEEGHGRNPVHVLTRDLVVQREMRERGYLRGRQWVRSTVNRAVYHLLPGPLRAAAARHRYGREGADVTDVVAV